MQQRLTHTVFSLPFVLFYHVAQTVKNLPAVWETWVRSLGLEDPLEEGMQPTPVFLPGEFHGQRLQSMVFQRVGHNRASNTFTSFTSLLSHSLH